MRTLLIDDRGGLQEVVRALRNLDAIAVDFEGEYNLHRYGIHLCLIQICDGRDVYLVDPVRLGDVRALQAAFLSPRLAKVMYSADEDVKLIKHGQGFGVSGLFDVQIAARLLGYERTSLAFLVERFTGVVLPKHEALQRSDWGRRPLGADQLEYAADDVRHLLPVWRGLVAELAAAGLLQRVVEKSRSLESRQFASDPRPYLRVKGAGHLTPRQLITFKYLFYARDQIARWLDWPPFRVLANQRLLKASQRPPAAASAWAALLPERARDHAGLFAFACSLADRDALEEKGA